MSQGGFLLLLENMSWLRKFDCDWKRLNSMHCQEGQDGNTWGITGWPA